jgi:hypothetical protein
MDFESKNNHGDIRIQKNMEEASFTVHGPPESRRPHLASQAHVRPFFPFDGCAPQSLPSRAVCRTLRFLDPGWTLRLRRSSFFRQNPATRAMRF